MLEHLLGASVTTYIIRGASTVLCSSASGVNELYICRKCDPAFPLPLVVIISANTNKSRLSDGIMTQA